MSVIINPVNFNANPSGGSPFPQTITDANAPVVGGVTQTPIAVVFIISGHKVSLGSLGTVPKARGRISIGFAKFSSGSVSNQYALGGSFDDNHAASSTVADYRVDNAKVLTLPSSAATGQLEMDFTLSSASAGAVAGNWSSTSDFYGQAWFIYGARVEASLEIKANSATIGNTVSSTLLGKKPDLLFAATCGQTIGSAAGGAEHLISFGVMARSSNTQACATCAGESAQSPTSVGTIMRNDAILSQITSAAGTPTEGARIEAALTSTGFDLTTRNANTSIDGIYLALYLGGVKTWVGVEQITAGSTGSKSITTPGWKPTTVGALAVEIVSTQNTLSVVNGRLSIGLVNASGQGMVAYWSRDNRTTSESSSFASQSDLVGLPAANTSLDFLAHHTGMTATGFDISVSTAATGDRLILFFAVADELAADTGTFTLTGNAATLTSARKIVVSTGTFALTGNAAGLSSARKITAAAGTFTLTGEPVAFRSARSIVAGTGAFTLSGVATSFLVALHMPAGTGVFVLTGNTAGLRTGLGVSPETGQFVLTGNAAGLSAGRRITVSAGTFTLTGRAVTFLAGKGFGAEPGVFTLTGRPAGLMRTITAIRTANARGTNALAGSEAGDSSVAGSERGA
jgi:hypothetical protein